MIKILKLLVKHIFILPFYLKNITYLFIYLERKYRNICFAFY